MARLSKKVAISKSKIASVVKALVDEREASEACIARAEKKLERQKKFGSVAAQLKNSTFNDIVSLSEGVAVVSKQEKELLSNASAASSQVARTTAKLRRARNTIMMQNRELANISPFTRFVKILKDSVALYEASKESLKSELAVATTDSTQLGQLFDGLRGEIADLQERFGANDNGI